MKKETKKLRHWGKALLRPLLHSRERKQRTGSLAAPRGRWVGWLFICGESEDRSRGWVGGVAWVFCPPFAGIECRVDTQSPGFALNTMFLFLALWKWQLSFFVLGVFWSFCILFICTAIFLSFVYLYFVEIFEMRKHLSGSKLFSKGSQVPACLISTPHWFILLDLSF